MSLSSLCVSAGGTLDVVTTAANMGLATTSAPLIKALCATGQNSGLNFDTAADAAYAGSNNGYALLSAFLIFS